MSPPPRRQREEISTSTKSPDPKKMKCDGDNATRVKGQQDKISASNASASSARRLSLSPEEPPEWFKVFFMDFESRLDHKLDSMIVKRLDDLFAKVSE